MLFSEMCPSGGTKYVSFEFFLSILRAHGEGRGGAPGTVPLQNPEVTSRKACLRNADYFRLLASVSVVGGGQEGAGGGGLGSILLRARRLGVGGDCRGLTSPGQNKSAKNRAPLILTYNVTYPLTRNFLRK